MSRTGVQTRQRIIEVATDLFGREGFEKVTMKQIAGRLRISEPAVYRYFDNKEVLTVAVLNSLIDRHEFEAVFDDLCVVNNVEQVLKGLASHIVVLFTQRQEVYRLLLYSSLSKHAHAHTVYNAIRGTYSTFLRRQLDRLYREKLIRKVNNEITSRCFIGMVFDCALANTLWKGMQGKVFDPSDVVANNASIYARGLRV